MFEFEFRAKNVTWLLSDIDYRHNELIYTYGNMHAAILGPRKI